MTAKTLNIGAHLDELEDLTDVFLKHCEGDDKVRESLQSIKYVASSLIKQEQEISVHKDARRGLAEYASTFEEAPTAPQLGNKLKELIDEEMAELSPAVDDDRYQKILTVISTHTGEANETGVDMYVNKEEMITKDPITKQVFVSPVRHVRCKHPYEKSTVEEYISKERKKKNRYPMCPYGGCTQVIRPKDLQPDLELKKYIQSKN